MISGRDTCMLRNSRLMGIPEFRSMANDVEIYRRSKVTDMGLIKKEEGDGAFQQRFYLILWSLLWRVCENYDDVSQADFYKLYRWFHVTRKLVRPPPPMPDYVSPFAKKSQRKEPVATIRMTTRTNSVHDLNSLYNEGDAMRSKVDPAKYLGSNISLTDSISSTLRMGTPHNKTTEALLQALSEPENIRPGTPGTKHRVLGTLRPQNERGCSTAPTGARRSTLGSITRPNSTQSGLFPNLNSSKSLTSMKGKYGYEMNGEVDADATFVDVDGILDQGSELMLKDLVTTTPTTPTAPSQADTPPLPSVDVLSKRQLKLIGTSTASSAVLPDSPTTISNPAISRALNNIRDTSQQPKSDITPSVLMEMAGPIGEKMMVNRARLLLLQHNTEQFMERQQTPTMMVMPLKPPTAPPGISRPSPVQESIHSTETRTTLTERATTAPTMRPTVTIKPKKLRYVVPPGSGSGTSVPCRADSRARESLLSEPFTVQPVHPQRNPRSPYPVPPPSVSSESSHKTLTTSSMRSAGDHSWLRRTPYHERCSIYKDPVRDSHGYTPLEDDESRTLSETPLLQVQDPFSSLSSFLPSSNSLVT